MAGTLLNNTIDKTDANQQLASPLSQGGLLIEALLKELKSEVDALKAKVG